MNKSKHDAFRERARVHPDCVECIYRVGSPEVYTVVRFRDQVILAFDVELALQFCQDGRQPVEVPPENLDAILQVNAVTEDHVDHVDADVPGIACPVERTPLGEPVMNLIDGSHRAFKCRREGRRFFAFHLTFDEAEQCQRTDAARAGAFLEGLLRNSTIPQSRIS